MRFLGATAGYRQVTDTDVGLVTKLIETNRRNI